MAAAGIVYSTQAACRLVTVNITSSNAPNSDVNAGDLARLLEAVQKMVAGKADREELQGLKRLLGDKVNLADHQVLGALQKLLSKPLCMLWYAPNCMCTGHKWAAWFVTLILLPESRDALAGMNHTVQSNG